MELEEPQQREEVEEEEEEEERASSSGEDVSPTSSDPLSEYFVRHKVSSCGGRPAWLGAPRAHCLACDR